MEQRIKAFESEMMEQLVREGYIKSTDKIETMQWNDNGEIQVNGKKIKDADVAKYKELHDKYFEKENDFRFEH